jgi:hypothetical protein
VCAVLVPLACFVLVADAAQVESNVFQFSPLDTYLALDASSRSSETTVNTYTWPDYQVANAIVLSFDLTKLPKGAVVDQATLQMSLVDSDRSGDRDYVVRAHRLLSIKPDLARATGLTADGTTPWKPSACCYKSVPLAQSNLSQPYASTSVTPVAGTKTWDLTTLVREWVQDPARNFGLVLNGDATKPKDRYRFFASTEHPNTSLRPTLRVRVTAADATPPVVTLTAPQPGDVSGRVQLSASATDNVSVASVQFRLNGAPLGPEHASNMATFSWDTIGVSDGAYTLSAVARDWAGLSAASAAVPVTVYNGVLRLVPRDTFLNVDQNNHHASTTLWAYTWPDRRVANAIAMMFDLSALPAGATVRDASLRMALVQSDTTADAAYTVAAHKLTRRIDVAAATGFNADGARGWTSNACCANNAPLAQADISAAYDAPTIDKTAGVKTWRLTTLVQEWAANPASNQGLLLNGDASRGRDRFRVFASAEHPDVSQRPVLTISYARGGGSNGSGGGGSSSTVDRTAPSVTVTAPAANTKVAGNVTLSATASDDRGVSRVQFLVDGVNVGAPDTSAPFTLSWNSALVANGSHTVTAQAWDAAGNTRTSAGVAINVSNIASTPPPSTAAWPNQPSHLRVLSDMAWSALTGNGWSYLRRSSSKDDSIVADATAPLSAQQVLQIIFTPSMPRDTGPSVHWVGLPSRPRELYTGWWMKMSPNWTASPAGGGKITFAWAANGGGQVYSNIGGSSAPHRININTEWAPYGQKFWEPNVTLTPLVYGQWYRIEWYLKWESTPGAGDGVMRWWVNGVLNGDYRDVRYPACCFEQFEYAPTRQNSPPTEQYLFIDHTRVSVP